jgi:hypothetical protein
MFIVPFGQQPIRVSNDPLAHHPSAFGGVGSTFAWAGYVAVNVISATISTVDVITIALKLNILLIFALLDVKIYLSIQEVKSDH